MLRHSAIACVSAAVATVHGVIVADFKLVASSQDVEHLLREARSRQLDADEVATLGKELLETGETDDEEVQTAMRAVQDRLSSLSEFFTF